MYKCNHRPMDEQTESLLELMEQRAKALYIHDEQGRLQSINQWDGGKAPRLYVGSTSNGTLVRFHADLPMDLVEALRTFRDSEPREKEESASALRQELLHQDEYIRLLVSHAPIERIWSGPAYSFMNDVTPRIAPLAITEDNMYLLEGGFEDWLPDVPHRQPFVAMVEDGHAVSLCCSVRITPSAHEAGVETLPEYRQRGHAVNAVAGWAKAVRSLGAMPFYSTSWDNVASQNVAARLGMSMIGTDFSIQ